MIYVYTCISILQKFEIVKIIELLFDYFNLILIISTYNFICRAIYKLYKIKVKLKFYDK